MALYLDNELIPGTHETAIVSPWEPIRKRTRWIGLEGESEIGGLKSKGGREITIVHWLHSDWSDEVLVVSALDYLDTQVGRNLTLTVVTTAGSQRPFEHVTFEGFEVDPLGVFYDLAGRLGWLAIGVLRFRQLAPNTPNT